MIREKTIEALLVKRAKQRGWRALKWTSPSFAGVPDRMVLKPGGLIEFVELKAPGKKQTPLQLRVANDLRALGFQVSVLDTQEAVEEWSRK